MDEKILLAAIEKLQDSQSVLVVLPKFITPDSGACGVALVKFLQHQNKKVVMASSGFMPETLSFLGTNPITSLSSILQNRLALTLNSETVEFDRLTYESLPGRLAIYVTAKSGMFTPADLSVVEEKAKFDCVITVGCLSLESLGSLYTSNPDIFFDTPVINFDVAPTNEYFGVFNLVDITAVSIAEPIYEFLIKYTESGITQDTATALLAAVVAKTHSFQDVRTTPETLSVAASLMDMGGNHQEVVQYVFKTKPLNLLKLWGRALARLKTLNLPGVLLSSLTQEDFQKLNLSIKQVSPEAVLHELIDNISGFRIVGLLLEQAEGTDVYLALHPQIDSDSLLSVLGQGGEVSGNFNFYNLLTLNWPESSLSEVDLQLEQKLTEFLA